MAKGTPQGPEPQGPGPKLQNPRKRRCKKQVRNLPCLAARSVVDKADTVACEDPSAA